MSNDDELVVVFRAPNEMLANIIKALLEGDGVPVLLESRQVPWLDGVMKPGEGYWGDVSVPKVYTERARQIIQAYEDNNQE